MKLKKSEIKKKVKEALEEDIPSGDITVKAAGKLQKESSAIIKAKEAGVVCGISIASEVFKEVNSKLKVKKHKKDGDTVRMNDKIATISGDTKALLAAERTAINFLGHLSGIATLTSNFVQKARKVNSSVEILDTRKTLPGLRSFQKYAVSVGGGSNHRLSLSDQVLLKENHIALSGETLKNLADKVKEKVKKNILVEVEVENLSQLDDILDTEIDIIMLDNFSIEDIKEARKMTRLRNDRVKLEVSGGVNLKNVASYAATGVDRISIGMLTSSAPSMDYSMLINI